jgi:hypothetical protein
LEGLLAKFLKHALCHGVVGMAGEPSCSASHSGASRSFFAGMTVFPPLLRKALVKGDSGKSGI